jgi:hypothetical protein
MMAGSKNTVLVLGSMLHQRVAEPPASYHVRYWIAATLPMIPMSPAADSSDLANFLLHPRAGGAVRFCHLYVSVR